MTSPAVQAIIEQLARAIAGNCGLPGILKLDFGTAGSILVDGRATPNTVRDGTGQRADAVLTLSLDDFVRMERAELDPTDAYFQGHLKIDGDMGLATKFGAVLKKARASAN